MRFGFIASLLFGFLLIYIGVFGLGGFGLSASFSLNRLELPSREEFQNLSVWTSQSTGSATATIAPVGPSDGSSVYLNTAGGGVAEVDYGVLSVTSVGQWTCFYSAKINTVGAGFEMEYQTGTYLIAITVSSGTVAFADGTYKAMTVDNDWHVYSLQVTGSGGGGSGYVHFFLDGTSIGSFSCPSWTGVNPAIQLKAFSGAQVYVDWLELDSGLQTSPALGPGNSTTSTGSLLATCRLNGLNKAGVTVTIAGLSNTTLSDGKCLITGIPASSYTGTNGVEATLSGYQPIYTDVTIQAGSTTSVGPIELSSNTTIQYKLTVATDHGTPTPSLDDHLYTTGASVSCSVTSPDGSYTCTGWTGTGSVQSSGTGTSTTFTITQNSTITWTWKDNSSTTAGPWTLTVVSDHGNPNPGVGSHTYNDGSSISCNVGSSVTEAGFTYTCIGWTGTGSVQSGSGTSTTFTITKDSTITWNWQSSGGTGNQTVIPVITLNIDWNAIWKNISALVDANRQPLLAIGGLISLFSFLGLMLPAKRIPISL